MAGEVERLPEGASPFATGAVGLVTGANSGIGFAIAQQLLGHGFSVWIGARNLERGQRAAEALGEGAHAVQLDVTDADSIAAAAEHIGELDILINNAGINPGGEDIVGTPLEQLRRAYETNVFGLIAVTQAFLPTLRRSPHPRIVNISSGTGSLEWTSGPNPQFDWERVQGGGLAYRSSKTAVNAVTLLTAQALGDHFKVNALAPGLRATNLIAGMSVGGDPAEAAVGAIRLALLPDDAPTGALWSWDGTRVPW
ncbi:MAG: SDR family NAD(P)-dependent oxidoreductase [Pseudolysinimonas sp.]|uniref:SDR family NAD(P)-dependent oxidoreductase n=1 Tax=Pseudolysinimonas sp. TaxID=2680009 RepID=UPI0032630942